MRVFLAAKGVKRVEDFRGLFEAPAAQALAFEDVLENL
jgi:hypothetical protein